ncbi:MAG: hypothetical protein ACXQS5_02810 [Candidatus Methanospirareceae archaeon]
MNKNILNLNPREGVCGICHAVAEEVCESGGKVIAYERPEGVIARIFDEGGEIIGEGLDIVWSSAVLAAEIDAGLIPEPMASDVKREGTSSRADIERVADLYGYGRVITPAVIALDEINALSGKTVIKREGLGVVSIFRDKDDGEISRSPITYCPTCAIVINAARTDFIAEEIRKRLEDAENTGKKKYELGVENIYEVRGGGVRVSIRREKEVLADRTLGCCIAYGTVKAEIDAGIISGKSSELFKAYCNLCPLKHCWLEKSMGALGNIALSRLSELNIEVEVTAKGYIIAKIPGNGVIEGRGTLCSLSALTNMLLRSDAQRILKPSPAKWKR